MSSRVRALVWEELRTGGVLALWACGVGLVACAMLAASEETLALYEGDYFLQLLTAFAPLTLAVLLVVSINDIGVVSWHIPRRILRLPVPTWMAVVIPLTIRTLLLFAVAALMAQVKARWLGHAHDWDEVFLITEAYLMLQLLAWLAAPLRGLHTLMVAAILAVIALLVVWGEGLDLWLFEAALEHAAWLPVPVLVAAGALLGSVAAVKATRHGTGVELPEVSLWPELMRSGRPAPKFDSPFAAQQWFFMHREGRRLGLFVGGAWCAILAPLAAASAQGDNWPMIVEALPWTPLIAIVVGSLARSMQELKRRDTFIYWLPIRTADLASSWLNVNLRVLLAFLGIALVLRAGALLLLGDGALPELLTASYWAGEVGVREILWYIVWPVVVMGFIGWLFMGRYTTLGGLALFVLAIPLLLHGDARLLAVVGAALSMSVWIHAMRKRLVGRRETLIAAGAWLLMAVLLLPQETKDLGGILLAIGLASLAPLPYASLALNLNRVRHGAAAAQHPSASAPAFFRPARARHAGAFLLTLVFLAWLKWPVEPPYIETWRTQGAPATLQEVEALYPPVPENENVAVLYERAAERLEQEEETFLASPAVREIYRQHTDYLDYVLYFGKVNVKPGERVDEQTLAFTQRYHEKVTQPLLPLLYAAATRGGVPSRYGESFSGDDYGLYRLGDAATVLKMEAFLAAMTGQPDAVAEALHAFFPFAASFRTYPRVMGQVQRLNRLTEAAETLEDVLSRLTLSDEHLVALQQAFADALSEEPVMMPALIAERTVNVCRMRGTPLSDLPPSISERAATGLLDLYWGPGLLERVALTRAYAHALSALEKGDTTLNDSSYDDLPWRSLFWTPRLAHYGGAEWRTRAEVNMAIAAAAAERYRLAHGEWPPSLEALAPAFVQSVPRDPYGGQPLRCRPTDDGDFIIYSVWKNHRDDGGLPPNPNEFHTNDLVFRLFSETQRAAAREILPAAEDAEGDKHDDQ